MCGRRKNARKPFTSPDPPHPPREYPWRNSPKRRFHNRHKRVDGAHKWSTQTKQRKTDASIHRWTVRRPGTAQTPQGITTRSEREEEEENSKEGQESTPHPSTVPDACGLSAVWIAKSTPGQVLLEFSSPLNSSCGPRYESSQNDRYLYANKIGKSSFFP